jgi:hypothetical protein
MDRLPTGGKNIRRKRKKELVPVTSCALAVIQRRVSFEDTCRGSFVLWNVLEYLDVESLKTCRQVNKEWEFRARQVLMKKCELNVNAWRTIDITRLELFTSWKLDLNSRERTEHFWTSVLQNWGSKVESLHMLGVTPGWTTIVRGALVTWCPNLKEIRLASAPEINCHLQLFDLQDFCHTLDRTETVEEFNAALDNAQMPIFEPFPTLGSIHTVTMEWNNDCQRMPACLPVVIFLIVKSCPRLKHLNLLDLEPSLLANRLEDSRFGILMHLARHPSVTKRLESFVWRMKNNRSLDVAWRRDVETQVVRFVTGNPKIPRMQFGTCLKSMHWDIMHIDRNGGPLLPGILNQSVAGNLNRLTTSRVIIDASQVMHLQRPEFVMNAEARRRWISLNLLPPPILTLAYPTLRNLRELSISIETCKSIRLHHLVDAVPEIERLSIRESFSSHLPEDDGFLTDMIAPVDSAIQPHTNLRTLSFNVRLRSGAVVGKIAVKFPYLQELSIGYAGIFQGNFDLSNRTLVDFLVGLHYLKRFALRIPDNLDMVNLIEHIADAQDRLPQVEKYDLRFIPCWIITGTYEYVRRKQELHARIRKSSTGTNCRFMVSWWNSGLLGLHEMYRNSPQEESLRQFISFVKHHRLPLELKYLRDHN